MNFEQTLNNILFPNYFDILDNDSIISLELSFHSILENLNSKAKIEFLKYCQFTLSRNSSKTWENIIEEKIFNDFNKIYTPNFLSIRGSYNDYSLLDNKRRAFLIGIENEIERIKELIPNEIKKEKLNLKSYKLLNKSKRGGYFTFQLDKSKIELKKLHSELITANYIAPNTDFENFYIVFSNVNITFISPIQWIGPKYYLVALLYLLKDEKHWLKIEGWTFESIIKHIFIDKDNKQMHISSFSKTYGNIIDGDSRIRVSPKIKSKLEDIIESCETPPTKL